MLIVGSKALKYHFPNLNREVKDIDIIGTKGDIDYLIEILCPERVVSTKWLTTLFKIKKKDSFFNTDNVEILNSTGSRSLSMYLKHRENSEPFLHGLRWASKEVLLSLKKSHINFPIKFNKHIIDYNILLNELKEDKLRNITKLNFQETKERFGELKTPSLKNKTTEFFGQSEKFVKYFYVPLMRICTTLCSGWFREFATDNWSKIVDQYDKDYVLKFLEAEYSGLIKKI